MHWAIVNNDKVEAIPKTRGNCPSCDGEVHSKCGEVMPWHWAHFKGKNCDPWYESETYWHIHWKLTFGKDNSEITIKKGGKWHRADIYTNEEVVLELQNSPIPKPVIREREEFYGERMMWLINGTEFKHNFIIHEESDYSAQWSTNHDLTNNKEGKKLFVCHYPRRSWDEVQRPVFIDFREETLFRVVSGMGSSRGYGYFIPKEEFIKKYGGDYEYYQEKIGERDRLIRQAKIFQFPRY